jgi:hypothetical protein
LGVLGKGRVVRLEVDEFVEVVAADEMLLVHFAGLLKANT